MIPLRIRPLLLLCLMAGLVWLAADGAAENYRWQWYRVWPYVGTWSDGAFTPGPLLEGLALTLKVVAGGLAAALLSGAVLAFMRLSPSPVARLLAGTALGAVRNTPLLMQLFIAYFIVAPALNIGAETSAALSLGLFEGCYMAEIFRAGIISLPRAQWEAAFSLGFGMWPTLHLVILPQALRRVIAPLSGQVISLIKDSSLISCIGAAELLYTAQVLGAKYYNYLDPLIIAGCMYLVMTVTISFIARKIEKRMAVSD